MVKIINFLQSSSVILCHQWKVWLLRKHKIVQDIHLVPMKGRKSYYKMYIVFRRIYDDTLQQQKMECKLLNRYFRYDYYKNMSLDITSNWTDGRYVYNSRKE